MHSSQFWRVALPDTKDKTHRCSQHSALNAELATRLKLTVYTSPRTMAGIAPSPGPGMLLADTSGSTLLLALPGVLMPGKVYAGKMSGAS